MSSFIPANAANAADKLVPNNGFFPDLSVLEMRDQTGLGSIFGAERIAAAIQAAMIETNATLAAWRSGLTAETLAELPAESYGGISSKVILYKTGVYTRARAELISITRDYDSTKSGHARADALEETTDHWFRQSNEALSRLTGRGRTVVELI